MTFAEMWMQTRRRVLTRNADTATWHAANLRGQMARFPDHAADLAAEADDLDRYAAQCRAEATEED